jgi:hypothetical protein
MGVGRARGYEASRRERRRSVRCANLNLISQVGEPLGT